MKPTKVEINLKSAEYPKTMMVKDIPIGCYFTNSNGQLCLKAYGHVVNLKDPTQTWANNFTVWVRHPVENITINEGESE